MAKEMSRRERDKLRHRGEIIQAAVKIFAEKGFHKTTMEDVAKLADFSVGTLYNFFASKEKLHQVLMEEYLWKYYNLAIKIDEDYNELFDWLKAYLEFEIKFCKDNSDFARFFIRERTEEVFVSKESFIEHFKEDADRLPPFPELMAYHEAIIQKGIDQGLVYDGLTVEYINETWRALVKHFVWLWLMDAKKFDIDVMPEMIAKMFFDGVRRVK